MTRTLTLSGRGRRGFTLVEMLVVIVIIGILAALLVPAVYRSIVSAREAAIKVELKSIEQAVEAYRAKYGQYPPDWSDYSIVTRHFKAIFPRSLDVAPTGLTRAQALVFCLRGFKSDPLHPFPTSITDPTTPFFDFDQARLTLDPLNTTGASANYPMFVPKNLTQPYVYFDARTYAAPGAVYTPPPNGSAGSVTPYMTLITNIPMPMPMPQYVQPKQFQIISAGLDDNYGAGNRPVWPTGITPNSNDADNVVNFNERSTLAGDLQ